MLTPHLLIHLKKVQYLRTLSTYFPRCPPPGCPLGGRKAPGAVRGNRWNLGASITRDI